MKVFTACTHLVVTAQVVQETAQRPQKEVPMTPFQPLLVSSTFETEQDARQVASTLLTRRLIACAQITGPVDSMYWWQQEIVSSTEYVLSMKTSASLYPELEQTLQHLHPYDTPEIIATTIQNSSSDYLSWMQKELNT